VPDVTERMNYFDRQFLRADDFQDEQAYHLDRRRGHNAGFHSAGVVEGLLVIPGGQADTVTVERGWAVDALGREIVLATPRADVPTGGVDVDVWISYPDPEPLSTPVVEAGTSGSPRVLEAPVIGVVPPGTVPANALRLARVTAAGTIDNSVRVLAGLKNNAVVEANLADNAVSSRVLAEAETGTTQDANSGTGVKTPHLKDRAVTEPKLADNAAATRVVANGAITEPKLANNAVSAVKLRSDAATSANRAVGPDHIQNQAVTSRAIAPADPGNTQDVTTGLGIKTGHVKDEAVMTAKLANGAVTAAKLQSHPTDSARRAVGAEHIQTGAVSISQLSAQLVFSQEVSIPGAPPGQVIEFPIVFDTFDGLAFHLVSVHYVGPRPAGPGPVTTFFNWTRRNTLFRLPFPPPPAPPIYVQRHEMVIQNPNTGAITVACRAYRLAEQ
jgi:hypothetical protein